MKYKLKGEKDFTSKNLIASDFPDVEGILLESIEDIQYLNLHYTSFQNVKEISVSDNIDDRNKDYMKLEDTIIPDINKIRIKADEIQLTREIPFNQLDTSDSADEQSEGEHTNDEDDGISVLTEYDDDLISVTPLSVTPFLKSKPEDFSDERSTEEDLTEEQVFAVFLNHNSLENQSDTDSSVTSTNSHVTAESELFDEEEQELLFPEIMCLMQGDNEEEVLYADIKKDADLARIVTLIDHHGKMKPADFLRLGRVKNNNIEVMVIHKGRLEQIAIQGIHFPKLETLVLKDSVISCRGLLALLNASPELENIALENCTFDQTNLKEDDLIALAFELNKRGCSDVADLLPTISSTKNDDVMPDLASTTDESFSSNEEARPAPKSPASQPTHPTNPHRPLPAHQGAAAVNPTLFFRHETEQVRQTTRASAQIIQPPIPRMEVVRQLYIDKKGLTDSVRQKSVCITENHKNKSVTLSDGKHQLIEAKADSVKASPFLLKDPKIGTETRATMILESLGLPPSDEKASIPDKLYFGKKGADQHPDLVAEINKQLGEMRVFFENAQSSSSCPRI